LIALYKVIQAKPAEFIAEMKKLIAEFAAVSGTTVNRKPTTLEEAKTSPESYYYWIRSVYNKARISPTRASPLVAAMLVFLNKTCFRGVYREGPNGFNVPYGNNKNPGIMDEAHVKEVSELFQGVVFTEAGFADSLAVATSGDFVYMDPPYAPENATSFVGYTADGFDMEQHKLLFQLATGLKAKGVGMSMSNAQVSLVTNAFPAPTYTTKILSARRAINSKKPESRTNEVLITLASHGSESQSESQSETHGS
jgi:DNA adenine methylase